MLEELLQNDGVIDRDKGLVDKGLVDKDRDKRVSTKTALKASGSSAKSVEPV